MVHPNSLANLEKGEATQFRTGDEQAIIARKGGIASGAARRKKSIPEIAEIIGTRKVKSPRARQILKELGVPAEDQTHDNAVLARIIADAENGKRYAVELWLKIRGEYPQDDPQKVDMTVTEGNQVIAYVPDDGRENGSN